MNQELKKALLQRCESMEIPMVGVANVERWNKSPFLPWMPEEFYPQSIFPEARSVIVIGLPISLPMFCLRIKRFPHQFRVRRKYPSSTGKNKNSKKYQAQFWAEFLFAYGTRESRTLSASSLLASIT